MSLTGLKRVLSYFAVGADSLRGFEVFKSLQAYSHGCRQSKFVLCRSFLEFAVARTVGSGARAGSPAKLSTDWSWMGFAHAAPFGLEIANSELKWRWQPSSWRRLEEVESASSEMANLLGQKLTDGANPDLP